jgi:hypothetical protein
VRRWRVPASAAAFDPAAPVRVDSGVAEGDEVGTHYDPMIAKIVAHGPDRASALAALRAALRGTQVAGLPTNLAFLQRLAGHPAFEGLELDTGARWGVAGARGKRVLLLRCAAAARPPPRPAPDAGPPTHPPTPTRPCRQASSSATATRCWRRSR